jgi:hypothetical protein
MPDRIRNFVRHDGEKAVPAVVRASTCLYRGDSTTGTSGVVAT